MKSKISLLLTFMFTFSQAMAFAPNQVQARVEQQLKEVEILSQKQLTPEQFKRSKNSKIRRLKRELKKVKKIKSKDEQTIYAMNKISKRFKLLRKAGKLNAKNEKILARMARKNGTSVEDMKSAYQKSFSPEEEDVVKNKLNEKIEEYGSYAQALTAAIEQAQDMTYETVAVSKSKKSEINRKPAQLFEALWFYFILLYIILPIALVVAITLLFAGGPVGLALAITAGALIYALWLFGALKEA